MATGAAATGASATGAAATGAAATGAATATGGEAEVLDITDAESDIKKTYNKLTTSPIDLFGMHILKREESNKLFHITVIQVASNTRFFGMFFGRMVLP